MTATTTGAPAIPAFRLGQRYDSLDQAEIRDAVTSRTVATVGMVNAGIIRRDLRRVQTGFQALRTKSVAEMLAICNRAATHFIEDRLPLCDGVEQSPGDYVQALSATCGLPHTLVRGNMDKIAYVLTHMERVIAGLTRGLPLEAVETGLGRCGESLMSFYPTTTHLGLVLPSNSPGVNSLWLPAIALRIPVMLKPGREDPWTPWRIINALIKAGCPAEGLGFYPADHDGAAVVLSDCHRVIMFGDAGTVARYAGDARVSVHGPGYSKILLGDDVMEQWPRYVDLIADSIARNGGRSCVNASTVVVPSHGAELAGALAEKLAQIRPLPLDHADARLAAFLNPDVAEALDARIGEGLRSPGAVDVTATMRDGDRLVELEGLRYLQPTVVHCLQPDHALARTEFLFPYASVVEMPRDQMLDWIGPTLVLTAITSDTRFQKDLLACPRIDRLNLGPIPTPTVQWDQPHEGNLFEFLYRRRAIQVANTFRQPRLEPAAQEMASSLLWPLNLFYAADGRSLPSITPLFPNQIPQPYRELLVHENDMTPTLEGHFKGTIHLERLQVIDDDNKTSREVILRMDGSEKPVEYGASRIFLDQLNDDARQLVAEGVLPLGKILALCDCPHSAAPGGVLSCRTDSDLRYRIRHDMRGFALREA